MREAEWFMATMVESHTTNGKRGEGLGPSGRIPVDCTWLGVRGISPSPPVPSRWEREPRRPRLGEMERPCSQAGVNRLPAHPTHKAANLLPACLGELLRRGPGAPGENPFAGAVHTLALASGWNSARAKDRALHGAAWNCSIPHWLRHNDITQRRFAFFAANPFRNSF